MVNVLPEGVLTKICIRSLAGGRLFRVVASTGSLIPMIGFGGLNLSCVSCCRSIRGWSSCMSASSGRIRMCCCVMMNVVRRHNRKCFGMWYCMVLWGATGLWVVRLSFPKGFTSRQLGIFTAGIMSRSRRGWVRRVIRTRFCKIVGLEDCCCVSISCGAVASRL